MAPPDRGQLGAPPRVQWPDRLLLERGLHRRGASPAPPLGAYATAAGRPLAERARVAL